MTSSGPWARGGGTASAIAAATPAAFTEPHWGQRPRSGTCTTKETTIATATIAYTPEYLDWQLGPSHPTNPERARLAVEQVEAWASSIHLQVRSLVPTLDWDRLASHYATDLGWGAAIQAYFMGVRAGRSSEWSGCNQRLGEVAALMFLGTIDLVEQVEEDGYVPGVYFNPQGAKHHAQIDRSSGFCVFNDMAWAARRLIRQGKRVAYIDWDAHHGDGVEAICAADVAIATVSIHDRTIFPGTGRVSDVRRHILNFPLDCGAGDAELGSAIDRCVDALHEFQPDVVLVACGADGLAGDPLSSLQYTLDGIRYAAESVGVLAAAMGAPVIVGGAGGYQPLTETPAAWSLTIQAIHDALDDSPCRHSELHPSGSREAAARSAGQLVLSGVPTTLPSAGTPSPGRTDTHSARKEPS